jgi:hypothetical protein
MVHAKCLSIASMACKMVPKPQSIAVVDAIRVMVTSRQTALTATYRATKLASIAVVRARHVQAVAAGRAMAPEIVMRVRRAQKMVHAPMSRIHARRIPTASICALAYTAVQISRAWTIVMPRIQRETQTSRITIRASRAPNATRIAAVSTSARNHTARRT